MSTGMEFKFTGMTGGVQAMQKVATAAELTAEADKKSAAAWGKKVAGLKAAAAHQKQAAMLFPAATGTAGAKLAFAGGIGGAARSLSVAKRDKSHAEQFAWYDKTVAEQRKAAASGKAGAGGMKAGGLLARVGAAGGMGQLGQIGSAIGSPLGAVGAAAVGVGLALRSMLAGIAASTAAIKQEVETRHEIAGRMKSAAMSADERAMAAVVAKRTELIGGSRGTPELRKLFAERDKAEKFLFQDQIARALKVGAGDIQAERAFIKAPEAVVLTESLKAAQKSVTVQEEIRDRMTWIQKAYEGIGNTIQGRAWNADWFDAQRGVAAVRTP